MSQHRITIEIDESELGSYTDQHLALCWHVAQANPAAHADKAAGELAERIGREIIRRWLKDVPPELWRHQGRHHHWSWLTRFATYQPGSPDAADPEWENGTWIPKEPAEPEIPR